MAGEYCKNGWRKDSKEITGRKPGGKKKRIHRLRWMDDVELYEEYGCKEMENKSFGQDIICI